jgi:hypothetical protein
MLFSIPIPRKTIEEKIRPALTYAGSKDEPRKWVGIRLLVAFLVGTIGFLIPYSILPLMNFIFGTEIYFEPLIRVILMLSLAIFGIIGTLFLFYLHLAYVVDGRKKMVENILPDFLFLVGNNLKSGMSPFYAFRSAVRPEFGPLSEEIKIATQKSLGIDSFSDALKGIGKRIDSRILSDTTKFFAQALHSGGHLAQLIETTAKDIKQTNQLRKELVTSTRMYTLFILFVVILASPMLLAVSVQFLSILGSIQLKTTGISGTTQEEITKQSGLGATAATISPQFMKDISYFIIATNALLASVFIGVLSGGKLRDGLKYAPGIAIIGIVLFAIFVNALGLVLGNVAA